MAEEAGRYHLAVRVSESGRVQVVVDEIGVVVGDIQHVRIDVDMVDRSLVDGKGNPIAKPSGRVYVTLRMDRIVVDTANPDIPGERERTVLE